MKIVLDTSYDRSYDRMALASIPGKVISGIIVDPSKVQKDFKYLKLCMVDEFGSEFSRHFRIMEDHGEKCDICHISLNSTPYYDTESEPICMGCTYGISLAKSTVYDEIPQNVKMLLDDSSESFAKLVVAGLVGLHACNSTVLLTDMIDNYESLKNSYDNHSLREGASLYDTMVDCLSEAGKKIAWDHRFDLLVDLIFDYRQYVTTDWLKRANRLSIDRRVDEIALATRIMDNDERICQLVDLCSDLSVILSDAILTHELWQYMLMYGIMLKDPDVGEWNIGFLKSILEDRLAMIDFAHMNGMLCEKPYHRDLNRIMYYDTPACKLVKRGYYHTIQETGGKAVMGNILSTIGGGMRERFMVHTGKGFICEI